MPRRKKSQKNDEDRVRRDLNRGPSNRRRDPKRTRSDEKELKRMLRRVREAKVRYGPDLLKHPDIHGIGIGYRRKGGEKTGELALVVHVYKKVPLKELDRSRLIPARFKFYSSKEKKEISVSVDIREVAPPQPEVKCGKCGVDFEDRVRPVPGGYSIGLVGVPGGTLGGWIWDNVDDQIVLISNEHVLGSTAGDDVIQQSATDGGAFPADHFANVVRSGTLDVAIAEAIDDDDIATRIECVGPAVYETTEAQLEMVVEKVGQTTGLTCGIVELIDYDSGHYGSHNDIWIDGDGSDFSLGGDSGSLYVEMNNPNNSSWKRIVGIHWGGSGNDGVGHPIGAVVNDLNLTNICTGLIQSLIESIVFASVEEEHEEADVLMRIRRVPSSPTLGKRDFYRGFARDFEKVANASPMGKKISDTMHDHRVEIVNFLLNGDGWRATVVALAPILKGCITTDDVLDHKITKRDLENFTRLFKVAMRVKPELKGAQGVATKAMAQTEGKRIGDVLFD